MSTWFHWAGVLLSICLAAVLCRLLVEIGVGFANAVSHCRFSLASMRRHGRKPRWRHFPLTFFALWFDFVGYRNRGRYTVTTDSGDVWRGIGDWTLAPAWTAAPAEGPPA